jgi:hypothetical protein
LIVAILACPARMHASDYLLCSVHFFPSFRISLSVIFSASAYRRSAGRGLEEGNASGSGWRERVVYTKIVVMAAGRRC